MLEKTIAHRGNLFAKPRKDFSFSILEFSLQRCNRGNLSIRYINSYTHKQFIKVGEYCPKVLETIPFRAGNRYTNELSKNRNTNWFKRILWVFRAGNGNIRENSRLHKGNIFPARKSLVSDIPAGSREINWNYFTVYLLFRTQIRPLGMRLTLSYPST